MGSRIELHELLAKILGSRNVYYQPPSNVKLSYDCIVYNRSNIVPTFADNNQYRLRKRYQLTAIYKNPDSDLPLKIAELPMCVHERYFTNDNLNHDVFTIYY